MNNSRSERLLSPGTGISSAGSLTQQASSRFTTGGQDAEAPASADSLVKREALFLSSLPVIDDVKAQVCRRHHLSAAEAEDFGSQIRLHFIERNYEPLRRFEGRSSLQTYLNFVIQRLFLDYRNRVWGNWRPSAEARRLGPTGMLIERLVERDGWTSDQVAEMFRIDHGMNLKGANAEFCVKVSQHPPGRQHVPDEETERLKSAGPAPDVNVLRAEQDFLAKQVRTALDRARQALVPEERLILRMRFEERLAVADIARSLHLDQKQLYRTIERLLAHLGEILEADGISPDDVTVLFANGSLSAAQQGAEERTAGSVATAESAERVRTLWLKKR